MGKLENIQNQNNFFFFLKVGFLVFLEYTQIEELKKSRKLGSLSLSRTTPRRGEKRSQKQASFLSFASFFL